MNRPFKIVVAASAILGLVLGCVVGAQSGADNAKSWENVQIMVAEHMPQEFAAIQSRHADADHARSAILFEVRILQDANRLDPHQSAMTALWIPYTRLAMAEESAGNTDAAHADFNEARKWMRDWPRRPHPETEMSDAELRDALQTSEQSWKNAIEKFGKAAQKAQH